MPTFTGKTVSNLEGSYTETQGLQEGLAPLPVAWVQEWRSGTGSNQANRVYTASASAAAAPVNFDFAGVLTDIWGNTLTLAKIKELWIRNTTLTTLFALDIKGNFFTGITAGASGLIKDWVNDAISMPIGPGGSIRFSNPIDGWVVTAATMDTLTLDPGANTVGYEIVVLGTE